MCYERVTWLQVRMSAMEAWREAAHPIPTEAGLPLMVSLVRNSSDRWVHCMLRCPLSKTLLLARMFHTLMFRSLVKTGQMGMAGVEGILLATLPDNGCGKG
jgi:hypothetical protein